MHGVPPNPVLAGSPEERELDRTWQSPPGFFSWFTHVNHRSIGKRFIFTAFAFFVLGGIGAALMRLQLMRPESNLISSDLYSQIFTMHGTTMMFLFAVPVMEGFGIYLVPLLIGTRDMAFPRLNAFGYYIYLIGGIGLWVAFLLNVAPDAGWFNYVPLAGPEFSPGRRIDVWAMIVTFIEVSAVVAAVELIVTIFKQRAPGMSLNRMPLFVWAILVMAFMIAFAMPPLMVGSVMLALDRTAGMHFFNVAEGGEPLLWQHIFWFFGHPEVYIIFIPALGMVTSIVIAFSRRRVFGYTALVLSLVATGFIGFGLWVHHMLATGLPHLGLSFFSAASMLIAVPSGVQIFCWIATLAGGRPVFATPLLFVIGFILIFVAGGLTGVMLASVPLNLQVHDTYFVVAHFHYVLIGGAVFPLFGGVFYWFPKLTGRMLSERLGKWQFWLLFVGFNVTFFPMHQLGFQGMPRRVYTYLADRGWGDLNLLATIGAGIIAVSVVLFAVNVLTAYRSPKIAPDDPWDAESLEWSISSPPPNYNFLRIPFVQSAYPLWDGIPTAGSGLRSDKREVLITRVLDAHPDHRMILPGPTIWPLLTAIAVSVAFIGVIWDLRMFVVGFFLTFLGLVGWLWPPQGEGAGVHKAAERGDA